MGDLGGCATGPYRTPTTLGPHDQGTESKQPYLTHRNKHREAAKISRQRNTAQMREQIKFPKRELHEMEISNPSGGEFKTLVIRMFLRMLKEVTEDIRSIKKTQSETKDALIEIKKLLQGNNSRVEEANNRISNMEH